MMRFSELPRRLALGVVISFAIARSSHAARNPYSASPKDEVIKNAKGRDSAAIIELGVRGDKADLKLMKSILVDALARQESFLEQGEQAVPQRLRQWHRDQLQGTVDAARFSMARLGDEESFQYFIVGASTTNVDRKIQCLRYVGDIGNKRAVGLLMTELSSKQLIGGGSNQPPGFVSQVAKSALESLLPDVALTYANEHGRYMTADQWRDWWRKNKARYPSN